MKDITVLAFLACSSVCVLLSKKKNRYDASGGNLSERGDRVCIYFQNEARQ